MTFTIIDVPQRSDAWFAARLGRLTGSCADAMLATVKTGEAAGRRNLRVRLVLERVTGKSQESDFVSEDMQIGIDREREAFRHYEALTGHVMHRCGFLQAREQMAGCSPDGFLGDFDRLVSIKCPKAATHLDYLKSRKVPTDYLRQCMHECWISGAQGVDFLSYHPDFPKELQACLVSVSLADLGIPAYEAAALKFLAEVETETLALRTLADLPAVLKESVA